MLRKLFMLALAGLLLVLIAGGKAKGGDLAAFVLSAMITGLAGALYVELNGFVSPAMLSWHQAAFAAGLEFGITRDSIDISRPDVQGRVLSAFARYDLPSNWGLIARVDHHDPDTDISPDQPDLATGVGTRVIAGVARRLSPAVRVLLNADLLSLQHGSPGNSFDAGRKAVMLRAEFVY